MKDTQADILHFWFEETQPQQWFQSNDLFDAQLRDRFSGDYQLARQGIYDGWQQTPAGALALCIILDQFPRNMFRGKAAAFATDPQALLVAQHAVDAHYDDLYPPVQRAFYYLPFMHSEDMAIQTRAVALYAAMRDAHPTGYDYACRHRNVIATFGRFPHRNAALSRTSTQAELDYLLANPAGF